MKQIFTLLSLTKQVCLRAFTTMLLFLSFLTIANTQTVIWPIASNAATVNASQFANVNQIFWSHTGDLTPPTGYTGWVTKGISSSTPSKAENAKWTWTSNGSSAGGAYSDGTLIKSPTASNGAAIMNSDFLDSNGSTTGSGTGQSPSPHESELISPIFDATGYTDIIVQFNQLFRRFSCTTGIQYSTDGGTTWSTKIEFNPVSELATNAMTPNTNTTVTQKRIKLTGSVGTNQMRIKFVFQGGYYFWIIDDVKILSPPEVITFTGTTNTLWNVATNWDLNRVPNTTDSVVINNKVVKADNGSSIITVSKLTILGTSDLQDGNAPKIEITGGLTWSSGTISEFIKTSATSISVFNGSNKYLNATNVSDVKWENYGTITFSAGSFFLNCAFNNFGTLDVNGTLTSGFVTEYNSTGTINNSGLIKSKNGNGSYLIRRCINTSLGIINPQTYSSLIFYDLTNYGELNIGNNVELGVFGGVFYNTTISGTGALALGNVDIQVPLQMNTAELWMKFDLSTNWVLHSTTGANISTTKTIRFGVGRLGIPLNISATGTLSIEGAINNDIIILSTITNNGTINWTNNNLKFQNGALVNNGTFNINVPNGTMTEISGINSFTNCGTLNNQSSTDINIPVLPCGIVGLSVLKGIGTVKVLGTLSVNGFVRPGNSPGTLTINAPITSTPTAVYEMEITGNYGAAGIEDDADRLICSSNIALGGTLNIILYNAQAGSYTLIDGVTSTGSFALVQYSLNGGTFTTTPPNGVIPPTFDAAQGTVTLTIASALSAELTTLKGQITENGNSLSWLTASEVNTDNFDVERSTDGLQFDKIGTVKAQGKAASYEFLDKGRPLSITTYYRLKINDLDNKSSYSKVISLSPKGKGLTAKAFPNPAHDVLTVDIEVEKKSDVTIELRDILGRLVWQSKAENTEGSLSLPIPLTGIANGNYFLKVSNGLTTIQQKIGKN
jgi:hypothetical protein